MSKQSRSGYEENRIIARVAITMSIATSIL